MRGIEDIRVALAAWRLGLEASSALPAVATRVLQKQGDGDSWLVRLAGYSSSDLDGVLRTSEEAATSLGLPVSDLRTAARVFGRWIMTEIVAGNVGPTAGARLLWDASLAVRDSAFHDFDEFIYAASEIENRPGERSRFEGSIVDAARRYLVRAQDSSGGRAG